MRGKIVCLFLMLLPVLTTAEILKYAVPSSKGLDLYWWPKLGKLKGWSHDEAASRLDKINVLVPKGFTYDSAVAVIYGRACYKPKVDEKTLAAFIESDKKGFKEDHPELTISEVKPLVDGDNVPIRSVEFFPKTKGNWERVSYLEEGDFYVIFTLSSRTRAAFDKALPAYSQLIRDYKR